MSVDPLSEFAVAASMISLTHVETAKRRSEYRDSWYLRMD